jgi:SAM-dependent methyltransferase
MARFTDYDPFASIYNKHWGNEFSPRVLPVLEKRVLVKLPASARILDLCCGTGQLVQMLLERGYQVTGLDGSAEMIRFARENAPAGEFIVDDARSFRLPAVYHAVVSAYDSLNHVMSLEELTQTFRNAYAALQDGGIFFFDLNMEMGFKLRWRGSFGVVEDEYACIVRANYRSMDRFAQMLITVFRLEDEVWRRSDLRFTQRCYPERDVRDALASVGFTDITTYEAHEEFGRTAEIGRMFFFCRKPGSDNGGNMPATA